MRESKADQDIDRRELPNNFHLRQNNGVSMDLFGRSATATRFWSAQGGLVYRIIAILREK